MTDDPTLNDELVFAAESETTIPSPKGVPWKLLVVDDDEFVHKVTRLVLRDYSFDGSPLEILSAHSGLEAREKFTENPDIAVIILDVVMETSTAGLDFVKFVREEVYNPRVRIILRTGQPGNAPENNVIFQYDINDYREKAELTSHKLYTSITAALRSFRDFKALDQHKQGLECILDSTPLLLAPTSLRNFAELTLDRLAVALTIDGGKLASTALFAQNNTGGAFTVEAGLGPYAQSCGKLVSDLEDRGLEPLMASAMNSHGPIFSETAFATIFNPGTDPVALVALDAGKPLNDREKKIATMLLANAEAAYESMIKARRFTTCCRSMVHILADAVESRLSVKTDHVCRVAALASALAVRAGLEPEQVELVEQAATLHDVGMITIPENILLKPSSLTPEEFGSIKTHTLIGETMLANTDGPVFQAAKAIAKHHHERWDGSGYPDGLAGDDIPLLARIVILADVFDSLRSPRPFRQAWTTERAKAYILEQRGRMFDPVLTDLFLEAVEFED